MNFLEKSKSSNISLILRMVIVLRASTLYMQLADKLEKLNRTSQSIPLEAQVPSWIQL